MVILGGWLGGGGGERRGVKGEINQVKAICGNGCAAVSLGILSRSSSSEQPADAGWKEAKEES